MGRVDTARAYTARRIDMAWTAPKVDWTAPDGVGYADMNGIGNNLVYLKAHVDATTGIHGAVSAATASKILIRDAIGRAKVVAPDVASDIALLSTVTAEAALRAAADAAQDVTIVGLGTDKVAIAGDTMTGDLIGHSQNAGDTTAKLRNIKLLTAVPTAGTGAGEISYGEIGFVYEV